MVRIRYGKERSRSRIPSTDDEYANERAAVLVELGYQLGSSPPTVAKTLFA